MSVSNGQIANEDTFNNAFLSRTADTSTVGILSLLNTDSESGSNVVNLQKAINLIFDSVGIASEDDTNANAYTEENYITDGDDYKTCIDNLDIQLFDNTTNIQTNQDNISKNTIQLVATESLSDTDSITKSDDKFLQVRRVQGDGAAITTGTIFGSSASTPDGTTIILRGMSASNTVQINNDNTQYGAIVNGTAILGLYDEIEFMYDSSVERWIEQRRNF